MGEEENVDRAEESTDGVTEFGAPPMWVVRLADVVIPHGAVLHTGDVLQNKSSGVKEDRRGTIR